MATPTTLPATFVAGNVLTAAQMNNLRGAFRIVRVVQAAKTDTFTASVAAGASTDITGLSITHTVQESTNQVLLIAQLGMLASNEQYANVGVAFYDGTNLLNVGATAGNRTRISSGGHIQGTANFISQTASLAFLHTPGAGAKTYTVRAINISGNTQTLYVNRTEVDTDVNFRARGASSFVLLEVSA